MEAVANYWCCREISVSWSLIWYTISSPTITSSQWLETLSFLFYYVFPLNRIVDATFAKIALYKRIGCIMFCH